MSSYIPLEQKILLKLMETFNLPFSFARQPIPSTNRNEFNIRSVNAMSMKTVDQILK